jgi:hypothetical protein
MYITITIVWTGDMYAIPGVAVMMLFVVTLMKLYSYVIINSKNRLEKKNVKIEIFGN